MAEFDIVKQEKKKNRSQFSSDERTHLMEIMEEYEIRLANKKLSTLVRKEIWLSIEKKFNNVNLQRRNAAQLKKYWQNFKYHSKKSKLAQKTEDSKTEKVIREEKVLPENWHQYCIDFDLDMLTNPNPSGCQSQQEVQPAPKLDDLTKFNTDSALSKVNQTASVKTASLESPLDLSTKKPAHDQAKNSSSSGFDGSKSQAAILLPDLKLEKVDKMFVPVNKNSKLEKVDITQKSLGKYNVVVSNSKVTDNKVVVSLICPRKDMDSAENNCTSSKISSPCVNSGILNLGQGSRAESYEMTKLKMFESLKRSALKEFNDCPEKLVAKSARITLTSKDKNKFEAIKKIPEKACVIRRIKNIVNEKVVDKEMKVDPVSNLELPSLSTEKIDKCCETEKIEIKDNTEVSRGSEDSFESGLSDFPYEERAENEIKVEDVLATNHLETKENSADIFVKFEWDHGLLLRQLETKELLLKLKMVETAIQEIRLRILALDEDASNRKELQDLVRKLEKSFNTNSSVLP